MTTRSTLVLAITAMLGGAAVLLGAPGFAQGGSLAMLDALDRGEWTVRYRGGDAPRKLCLRTGRELIQLQHPGPACGKAVVEDGTAEVTVHYTCAGNGYGRTNLRRESATLVQIESQGISGGLPFQFTAEARRTGACR